MGCLLQLFGRLRAVIDKVAGRGAGVDAAGPAVGLDEVQAVAGRDDCIARQQEKAHQGGAGSAQAKKGPISPAGGPEVPDGRINSLLVFQPLFPPLLVKGYRGSQF